MAAYVEAVGGWQETVTNRQSERVNTFVFTEIECVLHVAQAKLFIVIVHLQRCVDYVLKTVSLTFYLPPVAVSLGRLSS